MGDRPREYDLLPGQGLRIDFTDVWTCREIIEDGTAALFADPWGELVTLRQDHWFRVAPGFRISVQPAPEAGKITLLVHHYAPIILRHPPRDNRKPRGPKGG
ncbi:MAG TPA: hypothetical protein VEA40_12730 [Ramlibacter sp.]|nr:hypothetical protein [Ramlibacter sp.]